MSTSSKGNEQIDDHDWKRVSSFKPQATGIVFLVIVMAASFALFDSTTEALPLTTATFAVGIGLIALTCKVVQKRGNEYRVSTLFYNEVVTVDDVCMTVTKPGPFWTRLRIHLRRPARFGWMISFVSADEGLADTSNRRGRI